MTPTKELLEQANLKAATLETGKQIRLTADKNSWTLYNMDSIKYIGVPVDESTPKFFKNRQVYMLTDALGKVTAHLQKL